MSLIFFKLIYENLKVIRLKSKVIVINNIKVITILLIAIIFIIFAITKIINSKNEQDIEKYEIEQKEIKIENIENNKNNSIKVNSQVNNNKENKIDFPTEIEGTQVIGKIEIPKINLVTYILDETTKETLKKSVTKLCGPKVNGVGNLCIAGHNYNNKNMFKDLKKLNKEDSIFITDMKGNKIEYLVYDIYKVYPKETKCLSQETNGEREITLITCTAGAIKRLIVKATEFYD